MVLDIYIPKKKKKKKKKKKTQNYNEFVNINSMKIINMYILFFKICALQLIISIY